MRWMWATKARLVWALIFIPFAMLVLAVLAPVAAMQVPAVRRQVHRWVEDRLSRSLGREVRMEGAVIRPWRGRLDLAQIRVAGGETLGAGTLFEKIVPDIRKISGLVEEIASSSREQSTGAQQISEAIGQLDIVIQNNSSASEELAATAEELSGQAAALSDAIAFFKVGSKAS